MNEYTSHFSAAYLWGIPYLDEIFGADYLKKRLGDEVVEITVTCKSRRFSRKNKVVHLSELPLSNGAVTKLNGQNIASPELVFLQLSKGLDIHRLILLGLSMCSHSPINSSEAISSKQKLEMFIRKNPIHHGCTKAKRAISFIEDGAASFMEMLVFMMLTLPYSLGGYGLNGASLNYEIPLATNTHKRLKQKRCFVDLYYRKANLVVEYDSFAFHQSPKEQGKDVMRASALERQGISVRHLVTYQVYDKKAFDEFVLNLSSWLGRRIRIRSKKFEEAHKNLRSLLPKY